MTDSHGSKMDRIVKRLEANTDKAQTEKLRNRCNLLNLPTWMEQKTGYEKNILQVWENHQIPVLLDQDNNQVSNFQLATGEDSKTQLVVTTQGDELLNAYSPVHEGMHNAVIAMISISPILAKLDKRMIYSKFGLIDAVSTTAQRIMYTVFEKKDTTGRCVEELGGQDNTLAIIRTVEALKGYVLMIHKSLLNNKPLRVMNFKTYNSFIIPNTTTDNADPLNGEFYSPMFKDPTHTEEKYPENDLKMLAEFLEDMTFALNQVNTVLKKHLD